MNIELDIMNKRENMVILEFNIYSSSLFSADLNSANFA